PLFLIAQEAEETDSFSEDVIIVSASKIDESLSKTTEHVEVITGEMIEQSGAHTLNEVLNSVPGVSFVGKTVGNSEPLQMNGFTDEYVKILIDGVPV
ncbi:MAG: TonB-dependent receptor plug domain-containing protein, partial [Treponema sp.]|nr:TonB-dependent receptor plug domain-containing protein [Treponema sp.]